MTSAHSTGVVATPVRIQRTRSKGFNLQAVSLALNGLPARYVGRGTLWGNPHIVGSFDPSHGHITQEMAVSLYGQTLDLIALEHGMTIEKFLEPLRGFNLACFCGLDGRCHADTIIERLYRNSVVHQFRMDL
jgi:hypothetical protein